MKRRKVRENFGNGKQRRGVSSRNFRLALEPLETRRLLAGLNVSVLIDQNGSRGGDASDSVAANRVVYLDLNRNGSQDASEPLAISDEAGVAQFWGLTAGDYFVGLADGSATQSQAFPVRPDESASLLDVPAVTFLASADLSRVWSFDSQGLGRRLRGDGGPITSVNLGGSIQASLQVSVNEAWVIIENPTSGSSKLTHFDVVSGQHISQSIEGLNGRVIHKLVNAGTKIVAQLSGPAGTELAGLTLVNGLPTIGASAPFPTLVSLAGSPTSPELVAVLAPGHITSNATWQLAKISSNDFSRLIVKPLTSGVSEVEFSADGQFILAAQSAGGVLVFGNNPQMSQAAVLSEATSPLVGHSHDGRFVTGSRLKAGELITWQVGEWMPVGRTVANSGITRILVSFDGDELLAATPAGIVRANLAKAAPVQVTVQDTVVADITLGIRLEGDNERPPADAVFSELFEDTDASGELRTAVMDVDGDQVWFTILNLPKHGQLDLPADGSWHYKPDANFSGQDSALVKVFDGQAASEFPLNFNVLSVDDWPSELHIDVRSIPENSTRGRLVGEIAIVDEDGGDYEVVASDPRFMVDGNGLIVAPSAAFDFESEPFITLELFVADHADSGYQLSTTAKISVIDINEPPTEIRISDELSVPENQPGAIVGSVEIDDPDSTNVFTYWVSDSRFEVKDGNLQLKPNISLDFESADVIPLSIAVSDGSDQTLTKTLTVKVTNRNDPPTGFDVELSPISDGIEGSVVGSITVQDQDQQQYSFTLSDDRFEVVNGQIKLKEGESLDGTAESLVSLTVTATDADGKSVTTEVTVEVHSRIPPFQNQFEPRDVNSDGSISAVDALIVLNQLNRYGPRKLPDDAVPGASGESPHWVDVNGDGLITPIDVLLIINYLNSRARSTVTPSIGGPSDGTPESTPPDQEQPPSGPGATSTVTTTGTNDPPMGSFAAGEGEAPSSIRLLTSDSLIGHACPAFESDADSDKALDEELEGLLEPLSRERLRGREISG